MNSPNALRRFRALMVLLGALPVGGFAVYATRSYISEQLAAARPATPIASVPVATVSVLVAKHDLERGAQLSNETVALREIPKSYVTASAISAERFEFVAGGRLALALRAGEPLLEHMLVRAEPVHFAGQLRDGTRALTIAVDEVNAMSGLLQPGDRIDMQYSLRPPVGRDGIPAAEVTAPLLQDVLVLATGRRSRPGGDESANRSHSTITVQVDPSQAQKLIVAQRGGRITAVLRGSDDRAQTKPVAMDVYSLIGARPTSTRTTAGPEMIVGGRGALPQRDPAPATGGTHVESK
jgi:pilus assembly protein CpaB